MKVLDVDELHQGIDAILVKLQSMNEQIQQVHRDVEGIISLKESFKGKGGQAIRSYYEQCHVPLLTFFEGFLMQYSETLQRTKQHLQALEPSYKGFIRQNYLENELEQGLQNADNVTRDLTDEANGIIQSVSDIVFLPRLEDDEFALHVRQAKQQKQETIERLNEFDQQQTQALTHVRQELEKMHQYVQKIQSMFTSGEINISNFKIDQLDDVKAYQNIKTAIRPKGMNNSINEVWKVLFGPNVNLLSVQYQLHNQLRRLMPLQFLPLGNGIGTQPSSYIPQDTFYPFGYTATPTNAYYTNDGKKVNITNLTNNKNSKSEMTELEPIKLDMKDKIPISKGEMPWGPGNIGRVVKVISKAKLDKLIKNKVDKAIDWIEDAVNKVKDVAKGTGKYQVGAYKDIKGVEGLDAHHAGQKAAMKKLVDNYDLNTAPAINVPKVGHTIKGPNGIVSRSTKGIDNPRQLLARDIWELRRVYDDIPNSKLKELIELNKKMYPEMRK